MRGASTLPTAERLFFVGMAVQLGGLVREIGREARAVAGAIQQQPAN